MSIRRWDPFNEMMTLRDAVNRLIEESFVQPGSMMASPQGRGGLPVDLRETENEYVLEASLPGVKPEDVDVTVQGNQIRISGETKEEGERKGERYHLRERRYGRFQRALTLPENVQADQASCEFRDGMLIVTLPKAEESRPRRIPVGGQTAQIEGRSREQPTQTSGAQREGGESKERKQ